VLVLLVGLKCGNYCILRFLLLLISFLFFFSFFFFFYFLVIDSVTNMQDEMEQMKRQVTLLSGVAGNGLSMQTYTTSTIDLSNKLLAAARTAQRITRDPEVVKQMSAQIELVSKQAAMFSTLSQAALANPRDPSSFGRLLEAAKGLINASQQMLASTAVQPNHYDVLRTSCKSSAATITNLVVASKTAVRTVADPNVRTAVLTEAVQTEGALNRLVASLIQSSSDPNNQTFNNTLFNIARELSRPTAKLVEITSKILPAVSDENQKQQLKAAATNSQKVLQELISACKQVSEASGGGAIDEALSKIQISIAELDSAIVEVDSGSTIPASKADRDGTLAMVENAVRNLAGGVKKVTETSVRGGPELAAAVQAAASGIGEIILSAKQLASVASPDLKSQSAILRVAKQAVTDTVGVVEAARNLSSNPTDPNLSAALRNSCNSIGQSINKIIPTCRAAGSGSQECDQAAQAIAKETEKLTATAIVTSDKVLILSCSFSYSILFLFLILTNVSFTCCRPSPKQLFNSQQWPRVSLLPSHNSRWLLSKLLGKTFLLLSTLSLRTCLILSLLLALLLLFLPPRVERQISWKLLEGLLRQWPE
jgi:hypothetical protein